MTELLIAESAKSELEDFLKRPTHALLLAGAEGSGRLAIARMVASELLKANKLTESDKFRLIEPNENGVIAIDNIRDLKIFTKLKSEGRRVIIVSEADRMPTPAQNSFLKLLEEPPNDTFIILTALEGKLLPTVISRVQTIKIVPVTLDLAKNFFPSDPKKIEQAHNLSGGRLGLLSELLESGDSSPLFIAAEDARQILAQDLFHRLCLIDALSKDKPRTQMLLTMLCQMSMAAMTRAEAGGIARWERVLAASYRAETALERNVTSKLILTELMLSL